MSGQRNRSTPDSHRNLPARVDKAVPMYGCMADFDDWSDAGKERLLRALFSAESDADRLLRNLLPAETEVPIDLTVEEVVLLLLDLLSRSRRN